MTQSTHMSGSTRRTGRIHEENHARDAIALLKADHKEVSGWFSEFGKSHSRQVKADLAAKICKALRIHTTIEEEIFYPAFLEATRDTNLHHEAEVEHAAAKRLISEIEATAPGDEYFAAKVKVLSEMIRHHVREEEQPDGMFAAARDSEMDLEEIGARLAARKAELLEGTST